MTAGAFRSGRDHKGDLAIDCDVVVVGSGAGGATVATELALSGLLAGVLAALGAIAVGWVLAGQVFQFDSRPGWWLLPAGALIGGVFSAAAGWWSLRSVVNTPPMATLRGA